MSHETEEWRKIWREADLWFRNWHEEFEIFLPEHWKVSKLGLWRDPYIKSRKCMSLKFTEELWIMAMKNDAKFEYELTNWLVVSKLTWVVWPILTWALKSLWKLRFNGILLKKVYNFWAEKNTEELCLTALKIDAKYEGKMTCAFKNEIRNLVNFHRLKDSYFILESKMAELDQDKNSKQLDRPDAVRKLILLWK